MVRSRANSYLYNDMTEMYSKLQYFLHHPSFSLVPVWEGRLSPGAECPPGHSALGHNVPPDILH